MKNIETTFVVGFLLPLFAGKALRGIVRGFNSDVCRFVFVLKYNEDYVTAL